MKVYRSIVFIFITILVIFLSYKYYYLKWLGYETIPNTTDILDERNYAFAGYTFRTTSVPAAWTNMDIYKDLADTKKHFNIGFNGLNITSNGQKPNLRNLSNFNYPVYTVTDIDIGKGKDTIRLVQPFLDHPIFGSFLYSLRVSNNPQNYSQLQPSDYRFISLLTSIITGVLLFIAAYFIFKNLFVSLFSLVIYSTVPVYILSSRYALFENLLIPLYLCTLILLTLYNSKQSRLVLISVGLLSGLAFNIKETGIFIFIYSIAFLLTQKIPLKRLILVLFPFLFLALIYYGYAFFLSPDLMSNLLFKQAHRNFYGSLGFLSSISNLSFHNFPIEGYWLWGFISLILLDTKNRSCSILHLGTITYLLVFLFFGGSNYPWYYLPLLPSFILASAYQIKKMFVSPSYITCLLFFLLPMSTSFYWGFSVLYPNINIVNIYRLLLVIYFTITFGYVYIKNFSHPYKHHLPTILKSLWFLFLILLLIIINLCNWRSFFYITANWKQLPTPYYIN